MNLQSRPEFPAPPLLPAAADSGRPETPGTVSELEQNLQPIPESLRTKKVSGQFWIWAGANLAPINWVLGALGIHLGLGFSDTVIVLVAGNLIGMTLFGFFVLLGQRTGATGMVLGRAAFGRTGNYLPAMTQAVLGIGWCAVNTWIVLDLVMALFGSMGWVDPEAPNYAAKILVAAAIMGLQVLIAYFGYKAIAAFERWTVPPTILVLIAMSAVAWFGMDIDWGYQGPAGAVLTGMERITAMSAVMTAIGIGWGITWFTYAADYSRFVSREVKPRRLYLVSVLGQFIPVVWLGILGASLATKSGSIDPGQLIVDNYGALAIPVLFMVLHGPVATNILNIYTFTVSTQACDVRTPRRTLNLVVGVLALIVVIFFIFQTDFAAIIDAWLIGLVAWIASWGAIMLVHFYYLERRRPLGTERLFDPAGSTKVPAINWAGMIALASGLVATWLFMYGLLPATQGPVAKAMGGLDLSWLAGGLTSATVYAVLGSRVHNRLAAAQVVADDNAKQAALRA
ncbi:cytosine permease [Arthrobacter sp. CAN_C5]|uniref:purine-cytosine permease family protein n=1 Tax=Arthrobacter sp. CAN_C5 TaxID=2760706 RepID=UPI001AE616DD|nr:cytosine permease [Arthrobacter sp. CAN_C5]MBP2216942.1 toxin CptA [Arthrobacter sp. CAN_C5]